MVSPDTRSGGEGHLIELGPYTLREPVARGGMATVWRAIHAASDAEIAVKVLTGDDPTFVQALHAEAALLASFRSPYVVAVHDFGVVDGAAAATSAGQLREGSPWLALEWVPHGPLEPGAIRDWRALRRILMDVLLGLAHAHARGVLHRDVKPTNLLVAARDPVRTKLADFGIAFARDRWLGREVPAPAFALTPRYASPEQITGSLGAQGPWTDLYLAGCVAWTLATGAGPFAHVADPAALLAAHRSAPLPELRARFVTPPGFRTWLERLLAKSPPDRFRSAPEAFDALLAIERLSRTGRHWSSEPDPDSPPPRGSDDPGPGVFASRRAPFVGRERERDRVWGLLYDLSIDRAPRAIFVHGPSGVGSSALAAWLAERALELGVAAVARGSEREGLAGLVAHHLGGAPDRLDALLAGAAVRYDGPEPGALLDWLSGRLEPPVGRRFELAAGALGAHLDGPLLVWVDELVDGELFAFARWVITTRALPALFVFSDADERVPDPARLRARLPLGDLALERLSPEAMVRLLQAFGAIDHPTAVRIADRAAGDATLAVESLRALAPLLVPSADGWRLPRTVPVEVPAGPGALASRRLDALLATVPRALPSLLVASVLGPDATTTEWELVCRRAKILVPPKLLPVLRRERLVAGDRFAQPALLDAIRRRLGARGPALHRIAGQVLEERGADALRIGRHAFEAGDDAVAREHLQRALRDEIGTGHPVREGVCLDLLERLVPRDDPGRAALLWVRVERARVFGRTDTALAAIRKLLQLARRHRDHAATTRALLQRAVLRIEGGDEPGAIRDALAAEASAGLDDRDPDLSGLRPWVGLVLARAGRFREALQRFGDHPDYLSRFGRGVVALDRGELALALAELEGARGALGPAERLNGALLAAVQADLHVELGRVDRGAELALGAIDRLLELQTSYVGDARVALGFARLAAGRPGDAEVPFRQALGDNEDARRAAIGGLVAATARQHIDPMPWIDRFEVDGVRMSFATDRRVGRCLLGAAQATAFRTDVRKLAAGKALALFQRNREPALLAEATALWAALAG